MEELWYKVVVDRINERGLRFKRPLKQNWLVDMVGGDGAKYRPIEDGGIELRVVRAERTVYITGEVRARLESDCSRCLGPAITDLALKVEVALLPEDSQLAAGADGELANDGVGATTYSGDTIDLLELVRDEIVLELPMVALCRTECAGLCPKCGVSLNMEKCSCPAGIDSRWAVLQDIKLN